MPQIMHCTWLMVGRSWSSLDGTGSLLSNVRRGVQKSMDLMVWCLLSENMLINIRDSKVTTDTVADCFKPRVTVMSECLSHQLLTRFHWETLGLGVFWWETTKMCWGDKGLTKSINCIVNLTNAADCDSKLKSWYWCMDWKRETFVNWSLLCDT